MLEKKVTAAKPELLRALIVKAGNRELDLGEAENRRLVAAVMKKAFTLPQVEDAKAVETFFCE